VRVEVGDGQQTPGRSGVHGDPLSQIAAIEGVAVGLGDAAQRQGLVGAPEPFTGTWRAPVGQERRPEVRHLRVRRRRRRPRARRDR
jgi:hypothetical protein